MQPGRNFLFQSQNGRSREYYFPFALVPSARTDSIWAAGTVSHPHQHASCGLIDFAIANGYRERQRAPGRLLSAAREQAPTLFGSLTTRTFIPALTKRTPGSNDSG